MENLFWIGFLGAIVAGLFAIMQAKKVMGYSEGTEKMQKIAASIREGANAYLKHQYTTVTKADGGSGRPTPAGGRRPVRHQCGAPEDRD